MVKRILALWSSPVRRVKTDPILASPLKTKKMVTAVAVVNEAANEMVRSQNSPIFSSKNDICKMHKTLQVRFQNVPRLKYFSMAQQTQAKDTKAKKYDSLTNFLTCNYLPCMPADGLVSSFERTENYQSH